MFLQFGFLLFLFFACAHPQQQNEVKSASLAKYAVGFHLYERVDSFDLELGKIKISFAKKDASNTFIVSSTTQAIFLKALDASKQMVGLVDPNIFSDSLLNAKLSSGQLINFKTASAPDWEALLKHKSSILLGYQHFSLSQKNAKELGIRTFPINEYLEEHPLGKAEWIKVFGVLTGRYAMADSIFKSIEARYLAVQRGVRKKGVKVIAGDFYDGFWSVPGSQSYIAHILNDAGAEYLVKNEARATIQMSKEAFASLFREATYWRKLTPMDWKVNTLNELEIQQQFSVLPTHLKAVLYCDVNKSAYFEEALLHPDQELLDLSRMIQGENGIHFYRKIEIE